MVSVQISGGGDQSIYNFRETGRSASFAACSLQWLMDRDGGLERVAYTLLYWSQKLIVRKIYPVIFWRILDEVRSKKISHRVPRIRRRPGAVRSLWDRKKSDFHP